MISWVFNSSTIKPIININQRTNLNNPILYECLVFFICTSNPPSKCNCWVSKTINIRNVHMGTNYIKYHMCLLCLTNLSIIDKEDVNTFSWYYHFWILRLKIDPGINFHLNLTSSCYVWQFYVYLIRKTSIFFLGSIIFEFLVLKLIRVAIFNSIWGLLHEKVRESYSKRGDFWEAPPAPQIKISKKEKIHTYRITPSFRKTKMFRYWIKTRRDILL